MSKNELISVLSQFNPWWRRETIPDLPAWRRAAFSELITWVQHPPAPRAVLLSGPRQVGKTTLILQAIEQLLQDGTPPANIMYATFDHPILKLAGLDAVLGAWRELEPSAEGPEYLFLDEAQFIPDFGTWVKHQVDFFKQRRIAFTGSAMPLTHSGQESGVGRWHILSISTLSFYEYLKIKQIALPDIPSGEMLSGLFSATLSELQRAIESSQFLLGHFHEYLIRGGFPQTALIESIPQAQKLLREDMIDKVLKRDMTAIFGVRRILELEQMFIYLCMHDGGLQDMTELSKNLGIARATVQNYIALFEATHLLKRLPPFGYGKEILRGHFKLYLTDAAIASAILMRGKSILEDNEALGMTVETAVLNHLSAHSSLSNARFSYWKNAKHKEVDLIVETGDRLIPFEVKYRSQHVTNREIPALIAFCERDATGHTGFILSKSPQDLGVLPHEQARLLRIPAALFCYWVGEAELSQKNLF